MAWSSTALTSPTVGSKVTAAQGQVIAADLNVFLNPTSYTPTWGSNGTAPAIGNGSLVGSYIQVGKQVTGWAAVTLGSTSTVGTSSYIFQLPVATSASIPQYSPVGIFTFVDVSASLVYTRTLYATTTTTVAANDPSGVALSATSPAVPAVGDKFLLNFSYLSA